MTTQDHGGHVVHRNPQFLGNERAETSGIQYPGHTHDAVFGELRHQVCHMRHGIQRIGDNNNDGVRRMHNHLFGGRLHYFVVRQQQIVAAHTRLAREPGGNDDDVGTGRGCIFVGSDDVHIETFDRTGLQQIKAFALGNAFGDVDEDDVAQFLLSRPDGTIRAHISGADYGDFLTQFEKPF